MSNYYCKYCGIHYQSIQELTNSSCTNHPDGRKKGMHSLYEGSEKSKYACKYCGIHYQSIQELTNSSCTNHPDGRKKGMHSPAI